MNREQLNHCYDLHKRIDTAYGILESMQAKAGIKAAAMDGMPHGSEIADKVGNIAIAIADLKTRIEELEDEAEKNDSAVKEFANTFSDSRVQTAIQLRFISGFSWPAVSDLLGIEAKPLMRLYYNAVPE